MSCPFLNKLPANFLANYSNLLRPFVSRCPVMSDHMGNHRSYSSSSTTESTTSEPQTETASAGNPSCPFLDSVKPTLTTVRPEEGTSTQDVLPGEHSKSGFGYQGFFQQQILKKKQDHSYRIFKKVARTASQPPFGHDYGHAQKKVTVWCSNDYLGMTAHPVVRSAVIDAVHRYGSGSGGTRNISGNSPLHESLEGLLAKLHRKERALLFTSCYVANDSTLSTLGRSMPGLEYFSCAGNHASMIQGIKNSGCKKHIFRTCDALHLEQLLAQSDPSVPKIVVFETVHSMTGAISPTGELCDVAHKYGALTFVDEVHAVGLYGDHGAGVAERDDVMSKMDMVSGTLGKAFGNIGGYVAGNEAIMDMVRSYAPGFIFTTSLPPTVLQGAITSVNILMSDEGVKLRSRHQDNVRFLKEHLTHNGLPQLPSVSHIIPIPVKDAATCSVICDAMLHQFGHYVQSINYPTVPRGEERLRIAPTPFHTRDMMVKFVQDLKQVWEQTGLTLDSKCDVSSCFYCHRTLNKRKETVSSAAGSFGTSYPCGDAEGCPQLRPIASRS